MVETFISSYSFSLLVLLLSLSRVRKESNSWRRRSDDIRSTERALREQETMLARSQVGTPTRVVNGV